MNDLNIIKECLLKNNIDNYVIIKSSLKHFISRNIMNDLSVDKNYEDNISVKFLHNGGVLKFSINDVTQNIDSLIKFCINNFINEDYEEFNCIDKFSAKINDYDNINFDEYELWLQNQTKILNNTFKTTFDIIYDITLLKQTLLNKNGKVTQYAKKSNLFLTDNQKKKIPIVLKDCYLNYNLLSQLNKTDMSLYLLKPIDLKGTIIIKAKAMAEMLNYVIQLFYADSIFSKASYVNIEDLHNKKFKSDFDIISASYENIAFDSQGNIVKNKFVVKSGKIVDIISNTDYSKYLGVKSHGNANLYDQSKISHQMIIFKSGRTHNMANNVTANITIEKFAVNYIDLKVGIINGTIAYKHDNEICKSIVSFYIETIFDNIISISDNYQLIDNVYCPDVILKIE